MKTEQEIKDAITYLKSRYNESDNQKLKYRLSIEIDILEWVNNKDN